MQEKTSQSSTQEQFKSFAEQYDYSQQNDSQNNDFLKQRDISELKQALEYQIDIVLRLEEQRLLLLKQNQIQTNKIQELSSLVNQYVLENEQREKFDQCCQTDFQLDHQGSSNSSESGCQTDFDASFQGVKESDLRELMKRHQNQFPSDFTTKTVDGESNQRSDTESLLQYSKLEDDESNPHQNRSIFDQAQSLLKHHSNKSDLNQSQILTQSIKVSQRESATIQQKSTLRDQMPVKDLKFKTSTSSFCDKENEMKKQNLETNINMQKSDNEVLTLEIVKLTQQQNTLKKEQRTMTENLKMKEKENHELKKNLQVQNEMLDQLRRQVAELSLMMNTDKFKSIHTLESELKKTKSSFKEFKEEHEKTLREKEEQSLQLKQFKSILEKLTHQYEKLNQNDENEQLKSDVQILHDQLQELSRKLKQKEDELHIKQETIREFMQEQNKYFEEIEYFKNASISAKHHAERAVMDAEFFRGILRSHDLLPNQGN